MNIPAEQSRGSNADLLELIEQITDRLQAGDAVDIEPLLKQHPEYAERLGKILPVLRMMQELECSAVSLSPTAPLTGSVPVARSADSAALPGTLGDYQILREIGRGGMGVVYEAEQISLNRRVALKVLPLVGMLDERQIERFRNEARAAALLHHEHIVPIHGVGCERGVHYYAMQYVDGRTLADVIRELRKAQPAAVARSSRQWRSKRQRIAAEVETVNMSFLSTDSGSKDSRWQDTCKIVIHVAEALEHAHSLGVSHRDIKPSNLLLDVRGKIWVTDFGLAQIESATSLTCTGDILGTLRYMSPEQASGDRRLVDYRTDVYSLGITFYELLALRPAFPEVERRNLIRHVLEVDPVPLREVDPSLPRDLETIVLKAIQKSPEARYRSGQELADDLRSLLAHEPIRARRPTAIDRWGKWSHRHRMPLLAAIGVLCFAVLGLLISTSLILQERDAARRAAHAANAATVVARNSADEARYHAQLSDMLVYAADIRLADQAGKAGDIRTLTDLLDGYAVSEGEPDQRGFEWWYLRQQGESQHESICQGSDGACCVRYSRTGKYLAIGWQDGAIELWDAHRRLQLATFHCDAEMVSCLDFSPAEDQIASLGFEGIVRIWDIHDRQEVLSFRVCDGHGNQLHYALEGRMLLTSADEGCVRLWDPQTGKPLGTFDGFSELPHWGIRDGLACSADGRLCVAGDLAGVVRVYDLESRQVVSELSNHASGTGSKHLVFSPDGEFVAGDRSNFEVWMWSVATGKCVVKFSGHEDAIQDLAFHPQGNLIASADSAGVIRTWDVSSRSLPSDLQFDQGIRWSTILPDDRLCVWTEDDQLLVYDRLSGTSRPVPLVDGAALATLSRKVVVASPDGRSLLCRSELYDIDPQHPEAWRRLQVFNQNIYGVNAVAFSGDGGAVAISDHEGQIRLWETDSGKFLGCLEYAWEAPWTPVSCLSWSANGKWLAAAGNEGRVVVWDMAGRDQVRTLRGHQRRILVCQFSPDSNWLAAGSDDGHAHLWNIRTGEHAMPLRHPADNFASLAFAPDGSALATLTGNKDNRIRLWNLSTSRLLAAFGPSVREQALNVSFSADGQLIAASWGKTVRFYPSQPSTMSRMWPLSWRGHEQRIWSLRFSPNGQQMVTAGRAGSVRLWSAQQPKMHNMQLSVLNETAAFTSAGDDLIVSALGNLHQWNRHSGEIRELARCDQAVTSTAVPTRDRLVATAHANGVVQFWDVPSGIRRDVLQAHESSISRILFSPDDAQLLTIGTDHLVRIWDAITHDQQAEIQSGYGKAAAFSPDSRLLAVCDANSDDICVYNDDYRQPLRRLRAHTRTVTALEFSPNGQHLASASNDRTVRMWDVATGAELHVMHLANAVNAVAFSPDGRTLASGDSQGRITFLHPGTGRLLYSIDLSTGEVRGLEFSSDGCALAVTAAAGIDVLNGRPPQLSETEPTDFEAAFPELGSAPDEPFPRDELGTREALTVPANAVNPRSDAMVLTYVLAAERLLAEHDWGDYQRETIRVGGDLRQASDNAASGAVDGQVDHLQARILTLDRLFEHLQSVEEKVNSGGLSRLQLDYIYDHLKNCELALRNEWSECRTGQHLTHAKSLGNAALIAAIAEQNARIGELVSQQLEQQISAGQSE